MRDTIKCQKPLKLLVSLSILAGCDADTQLLQSLQRAANRPCHQMAFFSLDDTETSPDAALDNDSSGPAVTFDIVFNDPDDLYAQYYDVFTSHVTAAGQDWMGFIQPAHDVSIQIEVKFAGIPTAEGGSLSSLPMCSRDGCDVYEQGVAAKIRTGYDSNGPDPDARILIGAGNLQNNRWWFDPDPYSRTVPVPLDQLDLYSIMLHELGHILAYRGLAGSQYQLGGCDVRTVFDVQTMQDEVIYYFTGQRAMSEYGGPVPLTLGNHYHLANRAPLPGSDLVDQLMNGVAAKRGVRRHISALDLAVLADVGIPVRASTVTPGDSSSRSPLLADSALHSGQTEHANPEAD